MTLTKVSYSMIQGSPVNIIDFGADSTGSADSTTAIQNAINSVTEGDIIFPEGIYKISGPITTGSDKTLIGENATISLVEGANPFFFNVTNQDNVSFIGFNVNGNKSAFTYAANTGGVSDNSISRFSFVLGNGGFSNINVKNCTFVNMYSTPICLYGSTFDANEQAVDRGINIENCNLSNSNFQLARILISGNIAILNCSAKNITNTFANAQLIGNGLIITACDDVRISDNSFYYTQGTGIKIESANGSTLIQNNTCAYNDFQSVHLQESASERGDIVNHNERIVISNNNFIAPVNSGVYGDSGSINAVQNVTVANNIFSSCITYGIVCSGQNWVIANNSFVGPSYNRSAVAVNPTGILLNQASTNLVTNISIKGNSFAQHQSGVASSGPCILLGSSTTGVYNNINISGNTFSNFFFRGILAQNNLDASSIFISNNTFYKAVNDGTATRDISYFNDTTNCFWSVINNTASQNITVRLLSANAYCAAYGNVITASYYANNTNEYYSDVPQGLQSWPTQWLGGVLISYATAVPVSGDHNIGDLVYNSAPAPAGNIGWVCTTAGTPGTWRAFGTIA
jgi:hypothetical protein